jgi:ribosomal protein S18 acetylase RimI-like enzyme
MLEIRQATLQDAKLLCDLSGDVQEGHVAARPDYFKPHIVTTEMIAEYEAHLADPNTYIFLGEVHGEAIGYILVQIVQRPENSYMYGIQYLYIDEMGVSKAYRSAGYGELLIRQAFDLAKSLGITRVILNVWAFNERAIAFYSRQGFVFRDIRMEAIVD